MDLTLYKDKTKTYDALGWFFLVTFLAIIALFLLTRDAQKQYGAVAFGIFPAFQATDEKGEPFDQHKLHGYLSAVVINEPNLPDDITLYLHKLTRSTKLGRKSLQTLVLTDSAHPKPAPDIRHLKLNADQMTQLSRWQKGLFKEGIVLVDQNGVIRGVFDINDKLERMYFESAVKGIL